MPSFQHIFLSDCGTMQIILKGAPSYADFEEVIKFYQERVQGGVMYWDLDMRGVNFINSAAIGILISFNSSVIGRGGKMRLILQKESKITDLIFHMKLHKIIDVAIYS